MIIQCENCGKRFSQQKGTCPFCQQPVQGGADIPGAACTEMEPLQGSAGRRSIMSPQFFHPSWWVLISVLILGGGLFLLGLYGMLTYEGDSRIGGLVAAIIGAILLLVLQLKITVTPSEVRIQHLVFARVYRIVEIAEIVHLTTVTTRYGVEADRVTTVVLRMKDGREISLRPAGAQIDALIASLEEARERQG